MHNSRLFKANIVLFHPNTSKYVIIVPVSYHFPFLVFLFLFFFLLQVLALVIANPPIGGLSTDIVNNSTTATASATATTTEGTHAPIPPPLPSNNTLILFSTNTLHILPDLSISYILYVDFT